MLEEWSHPRYLELEEMWWERLVVIVLVSLEDPDTVVEELLLTVLEWHEVVLMEVMVVVFTGTLVEAEVESMSEPSRLGPSHSRKLFEISS